MSHFKQNQLNHSTGLSCLLVLFSIVLSASINPIFAQKKQKESVVAIIESSQLIQIKKLAEYNNWANEQLAAWLRNTDSMQWIMHIQSSFNTIDLTVRHLWNAEQGWLSTLKNEPWSVAINNDVNMGKNEILEGFMKTSREFHHFVQSMNEKSLNETRKIGKNEKEVSLADIIQHVYNHATHHRGQLITMGRQAGLINPPRTDYIYFITK